MADYTTQFSFVVAFDTPEQAAAAFAPLEGLDEADLYDEGTPIPAGLEALVGRGDLASGVPAVVLEGAEVWLHDGGGQGQIDNALAVARYLLGCDGTPDSVFVEWSNGASRPLLDAFGGGAAHVTADGVRGVATGALADWLAAEVAAGRYGWDAPTD